MHVKPGQRFQFRIPGSDVSAALLFWAENGSVCMIDERYDTYHKKHFGSINPYDWLRRLQSFNRALPRADKYPDERRELDKMIETGIAVAKEALRQREIIKAKLRLRMSVATEYQLQAVMERQRAAHEKRMIELIRSGQDLSQTVRGIAPGDTVSENAELPPMPQPTKTITDCRDIQIVPDVVAPLKDVYKHLPKKLEIPGGA